MTENLNELVAIDSKLEALFSRALTLAAAENGGEAAAELWLQARLRAAIAFDEHARLLETQRESAAAKAASTVEELRKVAAYDHSTPRLSTFTKVEMGEDVRALTAIHSALKNEGADATNTKGTGE